MSAAFTADHVLQPTHPRQRSAGDQKDLFPALARNVFACQMDPVTRPCGGRCWRAAHAANRIHSLFTISNTRGPLHEEQDTRVSLTVSGHKRPQPPWWSQTGSNRRPQACKASALPTELWPLRGGGRRVSEEDGGPGTTRTSDLTLIRGAL